MLSSLYSAISGLSAHKTFLDVTGNNIANINTTGFKSSSVKFADLLSQQLTSSANGNPAQVGLGVQAVAINKNFAQGSLIQTGNTFDLAVGGEGMFVVNDGSQDYYTRAGAFNTDLAGNLVDSVTGNNVMGYAIDSSGNKDNATSAIQIPYGDTITSNKVSSAVDITNNIDAGTAVLGTVATTVNVLDANKATHSLDLTFTKTAADTWDLDITSSEPGVTISNGNITGIGFTAGVVTSSPTSLTISADFGYGNQAIAYDFSALTQNAAANDVAAADMSGTETGTFKSVTIDTDGIFKALYTTGESLAFAQIERVTFNNPDGLEQVGDNLLESNTTISGPALSVVQTGVGGTVISGSLENSNVDITKELTNLIIAQRGFQANSRTISTSNQVLLDIMQVV